MTKPKYEPSIVDIINKEAEVLPYLALESSGNDKLWEAAVMRNDGFNEQRIRLNLHENLDQLLDLRARILHLIKKATL